MSSAAEAELGAIFINAKEAVHMRRILQEMGHSQPRTPIQTDNSTAEGVINSWICALNGCLTESSRVNLKFTGGQGRLTWLITLQSIIRRHIIEM
jgi:hypothetical protein